MSLLISTQRFNCDPENRPNYQDCYDQPEEPTCGYYTKDCPLEICGYVAMNGCEACSFNDVLYYEKTECDPGIIVGTCPEAFCNLDTSEKQFEAFLPACGLKKNKDGSLTERTFDTVCLLCQENEFHYYRFGPCREDRVYCQDRNEENNFNEESENIETKNNVVCASFKAEDNLTAYVNVSSGFQACSDQAVEFWTEGPCGSLKDDATYCLPNSRPDICTEEIEPVCGYYKDEDDSIQYKIMDNPCSACAAAEIIYHIPGPCTFSVCLSSQNGDDCEELNPICGRYQVDGKLRKESFTSCIHCHDPSGHPVFQTDELCPGDKGIRCENDAGGYISGVLNPVCGHFTEDCNNDSCRQTYAEPMIACDSKSILYSPGTCPGEERVSCENYRARPLDPEFVYGNVCGYTSADCEEDL